MTQKIKLIIGIVITAIIIALSTTIVIINNRINVLNYEISNAITNIKAYELENSALRDDTIEFKYTIEQLNYSKDSLNQRINKLRKDLKIKFLTVHKAKGLECDYVFILNTFNSLMGFPCNITDDKLIKMLLKNKEDFPYSEERRLFYVALTRAKKKIFLMVNQSSMSGFVKEIMEYKKDSNIFL